MREQRLEGVRVAVLAADGFEQVEVTVPVRALRRQGAQVRIISLRPGRIRGMNFLWRGRTLPVDDTVFQARAEDYGALLLPGGFVNPDLLRQSERARDFVREFERLGRPIATLCHGPELLISAGLVDGRRLTSWPGIADDVRNAGGLWENAPVVRDGRWVASRSPMDLRPFVDATVDLFATEAPRNLPAPPQSVRWAATLSQVAALGMVSAAALGLRAALRGGLRRVRARKGGVAFEVLRDLGLATALGGVLVGRLGSAVPPRKADGVRPRRRYAVANGLGLAATTVGWLAGRRGLGRRPALRTAADALLGGAVATGVVTLVSNELAARRESRIADFELGESLLPEPARPAGRLERTGAISGYAQAGALAGLLCTTAALRSAR